MATTQLHMSFESQMLLEERSECDVEHIQTAILSALGSKYGMQTVYKSETDDRSLVEFGCGPYMVCVYFDHYEEEAPYFFACHLAGDHHHDGCANTIDQLIADMNSKFQADEDFLTAGLEYV
jgi:hypothetical protein